MSNTNLCIDVSFTLAELQFIENLLVHAMLYVDVDSPMWVSDTHVGKKVQDAIASLRITSCQTG